MDTQIQGSGHELLYIDNIWIYGDWDFVVKKKREHRGASTQNLSEKNNTAIQEPHVL